MKKLFFFFVFAFIGIMSFAQVPGSMNYQAVIRDASGNLITNTEVELGFIINDGITNYYAETQFVTTDGSGIASVKVGEGTPTTGTWDAIDWTAQNLGLTVKIYNGSSWDDLGNTIFSSVPYANMAYKTPFTPIAMGRIYADNINDTVSVQSGYGIDSVTVFVIASSKWIQVYLTEPPANPITIITPRGISGTTIYSAANYNSVSGYLYINLTNEAGEKIISPFNFVVYEVKE